jgi:hypothetical protein
MSDKKAYERSAKRGALGLWIGFSAVLLGAMLLPLYWFWDRIASRPVVLVLILALLAWAIFTWWQLVISTAKRIRSHPER